MHLASPDWLYHKLNVVGQDVEPVRAALRGPGWLPWTIDYDHLEEDWFHRLLADQDRHPPRHRLSLTACRKLAQAVREAVWYENETSIAHLHERRCPLDLASVIPVPMSILSLGPTHPESLAWLWENWGTTHALRHVRQLGADDTAGWRVGFYAADWTPWRVLRAMRARWPDVTFDLRVAYQDGIAT
jgi:hypothetical protein